MELDYQTLDAILNYLKLAQGYRGWASYRTYYRTVNNIITENIITDSSYVGWCNTLLNFGLVDHKYHGNDGHTYIINFKGLDVINNGRSTRDIHEEIKKKNKLEELILEGTIESHEVAKQSTRLNKFQLLVTIILGTVSAISIYFQSEANNIAQRTSEIAELEYQLEIENKASIDTIIFKINEKDSLQKTIRTN